MQFEVKSILCMKLKTHQNLRMGCIPGFNCTVYITVYIYIRMCAVSCLVYITVYIYTHVGGILFSLHYYIHIRWPAAS